MVFKVSTDPEFIALIQPKYFKGVNTYDEVIDGRGLLASLPILAAVAAVVSLQTPTLYVKL